MNEVDNRRVENQRSVSRIVVGFLALLVLYAFLKHGFFDVWVEGYEGGDFTIYYVAAERIASGNSPYPIDAIRAYEGQGASPIWGEYPYPPLLARLLVPLTRFPVFTAKRIYIVSLLIVFFGLMGVLYRLYRPSLRRTDFLPLWAVLFGWGPFIYSIRLGQCELLAMPFLALAWIFLVWGERDSGHRPWLEILAGIFMGFAAMVRLTPVLMIPVFVVTFRWRIVGSFLFGSLLALVVSGPGASWEFLTEVLPTMSDVSEMRQCPAFHVLILRSLDTLASWTGREGGLGIDRWASLFGTGVFYTGLLWIFHRWRLRFSTENLFVLACYLPPLLAGKNPHHYALALIPVLVGSLYLVRKAIDGHETRDRMGMMMWIAFLLPAFNYWGPANDFVDWIARIGPISRTPLFILGNLLAFGWVVCILKNGGVKTSPNKK